MRAVLLNGMSNAALMVGMQQHPNDTPVDYREKLLVTLFATKKHRNVT